MTPQEYEAAVAILYEQMDGIGQVRRNVRIKDKITGQPRQVDVLLELQERGHHIKILVDAKFSASKIDVREVESVAALATSVGACKGVIVAANGWTDPAILKAKALEMDLKLFGTEEAVDYLLPEKWAMCPACNNDCIVVDQAGAAEHDGLVLWWLAGQCRACKFAFTWCQDCGQKAELSLSDSYKCGCGHYWLNDDLGLVLLLYGSDRPVRLPKDRAASLPSMKTSPSTLPRC